MLIPILVHIFLSCTLTTVFVMCFFRKVGNPQWFEKALMVLGICTGSGPNGLASVRAIDPHITTEILSKQNRHCNGIKFRQNAH